MQYRKIIGDAWAFTQSSKRLVMWFAFVPAVASTIYGLITFIYYYFILTSKGSSIGLAIEVINKIRDIFASYEFLIPWAIGTLILFGIFKLFYPTFSTGAIVQYAAHKRVGKDIGVAKSFSHGLKSFLPLFEYHLLMNTFSLTTYITTLFFFYRSLPGSALAILLPIFAICGFIFLILGLLVTYSEMYIIIDKEKVFKAIKKSAGLVVDNWQYTFLVLILLLLISLRMIFNLVIVVILPALIITGVGFFASLQLHIAGYVLAGIVSLTGLYLAGIIGGNLNVFTNAVWTFTFLELTSQKEESLRDAA
jgi:hypothetical protein